MSDVKSGRDVAYILRNFQANVMDCVVCSFDGASNAATNSLSANAYLLCLLSSCAVTRKCFLTLRNIGTTVQE